MSYLDKITRCNSADLADYLPLLIDGHHVGWTKSSYASLLTPWLTDEDGPVGRLLLNSEQGDIASRNRMLAEIVAWIHQQDIIRTPRGEVYPVSIRHREDVVALVDRTGASFFGIRCYGQHVNGYVRDGDELRMWVGKRAEDRYIEPGKLDQLVAGGIPHGISLHENLLKECYEEAGIGPELAARAVAVGAVSYFAESAIGVKPDTLYVYDLELPADFRPVCTDGEVESFQLLPVEEVAALVRDTNEFKLNCNLVVIDFLLRHGLITADDPQYNVIVNRVHTALPDLD